MQPCRLRLCPSHPELGKSIPWPKAMSVGAAGFDVHAAVTDAKTLRPGERALIPLGFALEVPEGFEAQVRPRSGLALKYGITCLNSPGTIDADYRGEVQVILINHGDADFVVTRGMRVAQLVMQQIPAVTLDVVDALQPTTRGGRGFGSTGV